MISTIVQNATRSSVRLLFTNNQKLSESQALKENYYKSVAQKDNEDITPSDWDKALPFEKIPGPKSFPVLGCTHKFLPFGEFYNQDLSKIHEMLHKKYGKICILRGIVGQLDSVFVFDPDATEITLRNEGVWPDRPLLNTFTYYRNNYRKDIFQGVGGLLTSKGEEWFKFRSIVNTVLMQPRNILKYVEGIDKVTNDFVSNIRHFARKNPQGEMPEDFQTEIFKWALESISLITLDKRLGCLDLNAAETSEGFKYIQSLIQIFDLTHDLDMKPSLWRLITTPKLKKYFQVMDFIANTSQSYVNEALDKIKRSNSFNEEDTTVLEKLLLKDKKLAFTMAMDMMMGGVDSTGKALSTTLYFLAKNPKCQEKLREEIVKILPEPDTPFTKEMIQHIPYLKAVVKETLRISPVAIGNSRKMTKNMVIAGYQIPKGTQVILSNIVMSQKESYVKEPQKFFPERWLRTTEGEYSSKNIHPFVFLPFGFGPRSCIGRRLANMELEVGLAKIIRNFEFSWPHKDMTFSCGLLFGVSDPLKLHFREIN